MPAIVRPERAFSFADHSKNHPREQIPGDRLDAQIKNLIDAIDSTQRALAEIRRDDGQLKNALVGIDQLAPATREAMTDDVIARTLQNATRAEHGAAIVAASEKTAALFAQDAEHAAVTASQFLSAVNLAKTIIDQHNARVTVLSDVVEAQSTDAENWANYSQAHAEVSETNQEQSAAWAEYLAGPVVPPDAAPAYISGTPWGHGLYYQPVEGMGGMGGLWSAKWWAIYCQQLVGPWSFYYLGGWDAPPVPGAVNPDTGLKVPNPIAPGSFYYDITTGTLYVWDGDSWNSPYVLASGAVSKFVYVATAGQTVFTGADSNGATPNVKLSPSDIHLNGVRLVETSDYVVDMTASTLTLAAPTQAGSIVQWDLLVPPDDLVPGNVHTFKAVLTPAAPDGTNKVFTMQYAHPVYGLQPVNVTDGAQLQVSLDGIIQEPGPDYVATGPTLTMGAAPQAGGHFWVVWFSNAVLTR